MLLTSFEELRNAEKRSVIATIHASKSIAMLAILIVSAVIMKIVYSLCKKSAIHIIPT
jgi:hypothetical protein